ncbi:MAG: helix-turn-helix domain-containing protein [Jatrophihabitans sp.]
MRPELQDIVDEAARMLGAATTLEDRDYNLVAFAAQYGQVDDVRQASILHRAIPPELVSWFEQFGIRDTTVPVRTPADTARRIMSRLCFSVRWQGVSYGFLWALDERRSLDDPIVAAVAELADQAGWFLSQVSRQKQDDAVAVTELLGSDRETARQSALRLIDRGSLPRNCPLVVAVVGCWNPVPTRPVVPQTALLPRAVLADPGPHSVALVVPARRGTEAREVAGQAIELYRTRLPPGWTGRVVAGIGGPRTDLADGRASWLEARIAARVAAVVDGVEPILEWANLGAYRLLAAAADPALRDVVADPAVTRLLENGDADLVHTARVFLDRAGNVQRAAAELSIHRQTLYYRIEKLQKLTGLDLADGRDRTRLHLALMLAPLVGAS